MCFFASLDKLSVNYILQVSDRLVTSCLPRTIWPIFSSFLVFCCYFTRLTSCKIGRQSMRILKILVILYPKCAITNAYKQFHWLFLITNSCFWLVNIEEVKMIKTQILWWKTTTTTTTKNSKKVHENIK